MDLYAYAQMSEPDIEKIVKENSIEVPRCRGYRLMAVEKHWDDATACNKDRIAVDIVKELCKSVPFWNVKPCCWEYSWYTKARCEYYVEDDKVRWDRIHGWKRKILKTAIHNELRKRKKQIETFNKYVGREDVLYVHARIGGGNWPYYYNEVIGKPWFIEKVDDYFDSTYCDIYAKIDVGKGEKV